MISVGWYCAVSGTRRYSESMRRPDIELSEEAAAYVERHPDAIESLASTGQAATDDQRARFRGYVRDKLAYAQTGEAAALGDAWLARHGLTGAQLS